MNNKDGVARNDFAHSFLLSTIAIGTQKNIAVSLTFVVPLLVVYCLDCLDCSV